MDQDLLAYYNSELAYLRELGAEFATRFPKIAGRLQLDANDCADPHVERLLEGFAFLTARVRQKLDDEFPEVTQAFLEVLYPHALRPVPSLSIAQFLPGPDPAKLAQGFTVPAGARLESAPAGGGQTCRFRTAYPVTLWPISLSAARLVPERVAVPEKPPSALAMIELTLKLDGGLTFDQLPLDRLRFYLDGDRTNVNALYELLFNHVVQVAFQAQLPGAAADQTRFSLPPSSIQPVGFGPDEGLFPLDARSFPGHRLLQEYFAFPEKFLFFDLAELQKLGSRFKTSQLIVQIFLNRSPRARVTADLETFRLGCAPIVNLFTQLAEPIILDQSRFEYRVIPDVNRPLATEIYSVEQVSSSNSLLAESRPFEPFYAMRHAERTTAEGSAHWLASRRPSLRQGDPGTEVYLSFVDPQFNPARPAAETLSVRTLCTNRDLPPRLPFGGNQGDFQLESPGPISRVRCLRKPTPAPSAPPGTRSSLGSDLAPGAQSPVIGQLDSGARLPARNPTLARMGRKLGQSAANRRSDWPGESPGRRSVRVRSWPGHLSWRGDRA